ncbi:hypothetical protein TNCV_4544441 [Trichonephila clavipes]|nr:hypothetical protein TNCV_4544441 [Trichonephila clavipes]
MLKVRLHVDQMHPIIPNVYQIFPAAEDQENYANLQQAETVESHFSEVLNKKLESSSAPEVPTDDVAGPDKSPLPTMVKGFSTMNRPVSERSLPRHSGRIKRPRRRLDF